MHFWRNFRTTKRVIFHISEIKKRSIAHILAKNDPEAGKTGVSNEVY